LCSFALMECLSVAGRVAPGHSGRSL